VQIQGQNISPDVGVCYPYKAIFDTLLENDTEYLQSTAMTELFYKDTAGYMDEVDPDSTGYNVGLIKRGLRTKEGKVVQLSGVLHTDLMGIKSYLPTGVDLNIKLYPTISSFTLMSEVDKRYSIEITECSMLVQYIEPTKQLLLAHDELLAKGPALFPFWRTNFRTSSIPAHMTTWGVDGIFSDEIPETMIIALVDAGAFTGRYNKNPFNFRHYNLSYISFYVEGTPVNGNEFRPDFSNAHYVNEYLSIFNEKVNPGKGSIINWDDYPQGYTLYSFNIRETANKVKNQRISCGRAGQSSLKFRFEEPLPEPVMLICYAKFKSVLKIDQKRHVFL
jgi:ribonucleoside-diphosphate reductase beta chain